jgi:hypothetical protein
MQFLYGDLVFQKDANPASLLKHMIPMALASLALFPEGKLQHAVDNCIVVFIGPFHSSLL